MNQVEINRLLHNLIRPGVIAEVDHGNISVSPPKPARVRVHIGTMTTDWIPWCEQRAGKTRTWNPPTKGEQVLLLTPGGELRGATVLMAINSDHIPAPCDRPEITMIEMPDGAMLKYDHEKSFLAAYLPGDATIDARGSVTLTAQGGATVNADVTINGALAIKGSRVTHNGTDIGDTHKHLGVRSGTSTTGEPA